MRKEKPFQNKRKEGTLQMNQKNHYSSGFTQPNDSEHLPKLRLLKS
ncbi:hypothetical protein LEP1GSC071_3719 [Leptospira santarosai str. JET]|nr:hypothetical protein LEP1GSC071_3719 [Leptospira santarosai str. JET]